MFVPMNIKGDIFVAAEITIKIFTFSVALSLSKAGTDKGNVAGQG